MRILLVSNYFPEHVGGIETVAHNLALGYRARGHRVRWLAANSGRTPHHGHPDDQPYAASNIAEERFGFPYPIPSPRGIVRLIREARDADVIHVHDCLYLSSIIAGLAGRAAGKPIVITQHIGLVPYRRALLRWLQRCAYATVGRLILQQASRLVYVSAAVAEWFRPRLRARHASEVIGNGIDRSTFKPLSLQDRRLVRKQLGLPESPVLLFSGRFVEKKGLDLLRDVVASQPQWSWIFIGSGDIDPARWGLPNAIVLPPVSQRELARFYCAADLLVLPSVGEGFPVSVQEAMACGTPVLVSPEVHALLGDAPAFSSERTSPAIVGAIAQALAAIGADPGVRERVSQYAVTQWNWDAVVDRYEAMLAGLIAGRQPASVRAA